MIYLFCFRVKARLKQE